MLISVWPSHWGRPARSNATMAAAAVVLVVTLASLSTLLSWLPEPIGSNAAKFSEGARMTLWLSLCSGAIGVVLGVVAALGRTSRHWALRQIASFYIWVIRGTPLLVQVLFVYFALPEFIPAAKQLPDFACAVIALSLNVGAYNAEAVRAGLLAIPRGQTEAARALGLGRPHVFMDVVFPQAFKISLPALVSNFIGLMKDSSLAYTIGIVELTNVGQTLQAATFLPIPSLATTACIYLLLTTLMTQFSNAIEHKVDVEGRQK